MKTLPLIFIALSLALISLRGEMLPVSNSLLSQIEGTWEAKGYGTILSVSSGQLREFHQTDMGCIEMPDSTQQSLRAQYAYFDIVDQNTFFAAPTAFGNRWQFSRISSANNCGPTSSTNALQTFDFFDAYMQAHFAFFEEHGMDWESRSAATRATLRSNSSDQQLYQAMNNLLLELGDPHTGLYAILNDQLVHRLAMFPRHLTPLIQQQYPNSSKTDDELFLDWIISRYSNLEATMEQKGSTIETTPFYWTSFGEIGYLHIGSMAGFSLSGEIPDEIAGLDRALDRALTDLSDSKALIIDLSLNLGGYEWISQRIARRFAAEPVLSHRKTLPSAPEVPALDYVIEPSDRISYHGPLYLLTSDITISAGEDLTLSLRALPQTRHYGMRTYGALSNILSKPLPNGWGLTISNEVYSDFEGRVWEVQGIPPHYEIDLYSEGIQGSHYELAKSIAELVEENLAIGPLLTAISANPFTLSVEEAEPGSTLTLLHSRDLQSWETETSWRYEGPTVLPLSLQATDSPHFYRLMQN
ncbi:S41 family peptidase [Pelagicoccus albus]|uniref:S41 family peptidase n=1 Tax=Pelagicoccus albus TaxID=415222 RepID=A0A7X1B9D2_9BACT|nr:S41 family peptidase [Pelagicoccus albus]MBC2608097.1 S41 family peptidase [Pelagicoccus albus]